jgi:hypothetical protein
MPMSLRINDRVRTECGDVGAIVALGPNQTAIVDFEHAAVAMPLTALRRIDRGDGLGAGPRAAFFGRLEAPESPPHGAAPTAEPEDAAAPDANLSEEADDLRPISPLVASCMLARQLGALAPLSERRAHWFATPGEGLLAAVVRNESQGDWTYAILNRDQGGDYQKLAGASGYPTLEDARRALYHKRRELNG